METEATTTDTTTTEATTTDASTTESLLGQQEAEQQTTDDQQQKAEDKGEQESDKSKDDADAESDDKSDDEKAGESESEPEYSEFQLPEDMQVDATILDKATPLFKEAGLTQEQAQQFVDIYAEQIQNHQTAQVEAFNQLRQGWQESSKNDSEFGGDKFDESIADARVALDKLGTPELVKLLNETGVGDHPEVIRLMKNIGSLIKEDRPSSASGKGTTGEKSREEILYGNS